MVPHRRYENLRTGMLGHWLHGSVLQPLNERRQSASLQNGRCRKDPDVDHHQHGIDATLYASKNQMH
jgi:hypothetical protein